MINFPLNYWKRPDAHTWTLRTSASVTGFGNIRMAYAPPPVNRFVAVAQAGSILLPSTTAYSTDGETWAAGGNIASGDAQVSNLVWAEEIGFLWRA